MARELYQLPANGGIVGAGPGWVNYSDSEHTTSNRQTILAGVRTLFTVDTLGGGTDTLHRDTLPLNLWNNNTINPAAVGETYSRRVSVSVAPTGASAGYVNLNMDIGDGSIIDITNEFLPLTKGSGVTHSFSEGLPIFCKETFNANGGKLYLTPSINCEVWGRAIFLQRTYTP